MDKLVKKLIKQNYETAERVAGYILKWEDSQTPVYRKALKNLESKGTTKFTRKQKIAISEWANEFGKQSPKVVICMNNLRILLGEITILEKKHPNLSKYIKRHRFNPPFKLKIKK